MARGGLLICVNLHMSYVVFRKKRWVPMAAPEDNFTSCPNALAFAGVRCGWDSPGDGEAWGGGALRTQQARRQLRAGNAFAENTREMGSAELPAPARCPQWPSSCRPLPSAQRTPGSLRANHRLYPSAGRPACVTRATPSFPIG